MLTVLLVIHLVIALLLIGVVMLQKSEGGALGIGNSASGSIFSARGVGNALTRTTAILAVAFFVTSISLTLLTLHGQRGGESIFGGAASQSAPATPSNAPAGQPSPVLPQLPSPGQAPAQMPVAP